MKGGVIKRNKDLDDLEVLKEFLLDSKCIILTDKSLNCITYKFTRNRNLEKPSPYIACRSNNLNEDVNSILLKIFLSSDKEYLPKERSNGISKIPTTSYKSMLDEIELQEYVYKKSYTSQISKCEPICPSIIMYSDTLNAETEELIYQIIINNIQNRKLYKTKKDGSKIMIDDKYITNSWFDKNVKYKNVNQKGVKVIVMELLEGYTTLHNYIIENIENKDRQIKAIHKALWQFVNLSSVIGVAHKDCHFENIMINENNKYFDEIDVGQPIIIDFGRAEIIDNDEIAIPDTKSIDIMKSINNKEQYIKELSKHKYLDILHRVKEIIIMRNAKTNEITLIDYFMFYLKNMGIVDFNINYDYFNELTILRINMTEKFNEKLIESNIDFNEIVLSTFNTTKPKKRKRNNENNIKNIKNNEQTNEQSQSKKPMISLFDTADDQNFFSNLFAGLYSGKNTLGGGNFNINNSGNKISKEVIIYNIENEISSRPIEIIMTNKILSYQQYPEKLKTGYSTTSPNIPNIHTIPTTSQTISAYGGKRNNKNKTKYKTMKHKTMKRKTMKRKTMKHKSMKRKTIKRKTIN